MATYALGHAGVMQGVKRDLSPEQKAERRSAGKAKAAAALERLDAGIARIVADDDAFAEYLRLSGHMHGYSWGNRLLIWIQRPDAGLVAGFHAWKQLGRPVVKGAKGIQILAPMVRKENVGEDKAGLTESRSGATVDADGTVRKVVGFRVAYVFAVSDTEGGPVSLPQPVPLDDDSQAARDAERLLQHRAVTLGVVLDMSESPELGNGTDGKPAGLYRASERLIIVNAALPAAHRAKTLAHELAHHVAGKLGRADGEIVAEGAAYVVAGFFGLPTDGYSIPYVANWSAQADGGPARVRALLESIAKVADEILSDMPECFSCGATPQAGEGCVACMA